MKYAEILLTVALVLTLCSAFSLKKGEHKPIYAFGVSASFTDAVVYYTETQVSDSVAPDKSGFLPHREVYSYQPKSYLGIDRGQSNCTCMIHFSENQKKLEKEAAKISGKYEKNQSVVPEKINTQSFKFTKPEE